MRALVAGMLAGALAAVSVLVVGLTVTAWLAIVFSVAAIVIGCADYLRSLP